MENKIIELAILQPYAYPWKRHIFHIDKTEIDSIIEKNELNTHRERRIAGYELDIICYLTAYKVKDYGELKKKIFESLKHRQYMSEELIERVLSRKYLADIDEVKAYTKFINNNMTIEEKNKFNKAIELWLIDLFYYYKCASNANIKSDSIKEYILKVIEKNYHENGFDSKFIDRLINVRAFDRQYIIELVHKISNKFKNELSQLLEKYIIKFDDEVSNLSFEDELFDIISDISDFDLDDELNEELINKCENNLTKESNEIEESIEENIIEEKNTETKENKIEIHLKGLAESLGYKITNVMNDQEDTSEIDMLKDLASYKKGAVLSELYNAYENFHNVSKENLEAIINNLFTSLKLLGFEVDDTKKVGDTVVVDTKDLLSEFVLTKPIAEKGIIEGKIKYLSWMYKGNKVTPMVIKPINK